MAEGRKVDLSANYRLLGLVGQGQFARVDCTIHRQTGQMLAIKQSRHRSAQQAQEPSMLCQLNHPNVMNCQAAASTPSGYQLILEYCEGGTLRSHLDTAAPIPLSETKALIGDILKGLSHIHQQGIIHGDLKPENILLTYSLTRLTAKIGDFGSACFAERPNRSRQEIGSPTYAAPERFEGESSYATDLYSVGVMLYEMLLGDRPFSGNPDTLRQAHQTQPIPLPAQLTHPAQKLLTTALHKQPDQRFASAAAMLTALQQLSAVYSSAQSSVPALKVPAVKLSQPLSPIPVESITEPIESLLTIPQGCCIVTAKSLHVLTHQRQLIPVAQFDQACQTAVDPNGRWFFALPQQPLAPVQVLAIDSRHCLHVQTFPAHTQLECFTHRGQSIGQLSVNLPILKMAVTPVPYQLIALTAPSQAAATALLITLKPFRIQQLRLPIRCEQVSALSWGYAVADSRNMLLLDRSAEPVSLIEGLPMISAIAPLSNHELLLASNPDLRAQKTSPDRAPSLFVVDLKSLDVDLVF
ncbi:MAG: serine/threonine-protein kinase [Phormidesmis sp.]